VHSVRPRPEKQPTLRPTPRQSGSKKKGAGGPFSPTSGLAKSKYVSSNVKIYCTLAKSPENCRPGPVPPATPIYVNALTLSIKSRLASEDDVVCGNPSKLVLSAGPRRKKRTRIAMDPKLRTGAYDVPSASIKSRRSVGAKI